MDAFAAPVRDGHLTYNGELLIDPGNSKHYKRASEVELRGLLKPDPKSVAKDETAHFYEAQLIHHGL